MAYSLEDEIYLALYGVWKHADDDEKKYSGWAQSSMTAMAHLQTGIQLADENLGARPPAPFASAEAMERLDRVRAEYDPPQGRFFYSWMGRV